MRTKILQLIAVIALLMSTVFNLSANAIPDTTLSKIKSVVSEVTRGCLNDYEKAEAIYDWMVRNVEYDEEMLNNFHLICCAFEHLDLPEQTKQIISDDYVRGWNRVNLNDGALVFEIRKGICSSISHLYKLMCEVAGLKCKIVVGMHVYDQDYAPGHAWNIVKINGRKCLVDVTRGINYPWSSFDMNPKERLKSGYIPVHPQDQCLVFPHSNSRCAKDIVRDETKEIRHFHSLGIVKKISSLKQFFCDIKCTY